MTILATGGTFGESLALPHAAFELFPVRARHGRGRSALRLLNQRNELFFRLASPLRVNERIKIRTYGGKAALSCLGLDKLLVHPGQRNGHINRLLSALMSKSYRCDYYLSIGRPEALTGAGSENSITPRGASFPRRKSVARGFES